MMIKRGKSLVKSIIQSYPSYIVILSLVAAIVLGTLLLALPAAQKVQISFLDLLFTSTSLTTVTGLFTIPLENFTNFGQVIILILMQIGGLGMITLSLCFMSLFSNLGLHTQVLVSEVLSIQSFKDARRILLFIVGLTLLCELIGSIIIFQTIQHDYSLRKAVFLSVFHSVSAFCNAGISLFPEGHIPYNNHIIFLSITTFLIFMGGFGFITWHEFAQKIKRSITRKYKISWHTRLIIKMFFITTVVSGILFWILERNNTLAHMTPLQTIANVILAGFSMKSTGFIPLEIRNMQLATLLLLIIVSFIGSAPSSTGSGIKMGIFAIFLAVIRATIEGRSHAEILGRRIAREQVYKSMSIITLALSWILFTTFCLLIVETHWSFIDILFEAVSAFSNSGMSTGITSHLTNIGKIFITLSMLLGRVGPLALIIGMKRDVSDFAYPEEKVILS